MRCLDAITRRRALLSALGVSGVAAGARPPGGEETASGPMPPPADLANLFEFRDAARRRLPADRYDAVGGGTDRGGFERITFRPRLMVNVAQLDLSTELLGQKLFAPILVGPMAELGAYHPDGEVALVRGAAAAKTAVVLSVRSSHKLADVVAAAESPLWYQVYPDVQPTATIAAAKEGVQAGCRAVCLTVGAGPAVTGSITWDGIARLKEAVSVPLVLKGIMSPEDAVKAASVGVDAVVVSNHGGKAAAGLAETIEVLPAVAEAAGDKLPILIDGGFRRGTDVLKALALGARAVLIARPAVWGLAAYGADGVQAVMEMLQSELARNMALCGRPNLAAVDRSLVKLHRR